MNLGVGMRAARTAGSHAMDRFYRPYSAPQSGKRCADCSWPTRAVECLGERFDGSERRLA
jgi:hypothetical protein